MDICISITTIGSAESLEGLVVVRDESQCRVSNCLCLKIQFELVRNRRQHWREKHALHESIESSSVATAAEWAIWGMGSTIATMAALWCTMVDTGTLVIGSYAGLGAR